MKKYITSLAALVLVLTLCCGQGLAIYGDVTTRSVDAYLDPEMTQYVGTIPQYTSVIVYDADSDIASLNVNGVDCYVSPRALTNSRFDYLYKGFSTLLPGSYVFQRPSTSSRNVHCSNAHNVLVIGAKGDWVLIRSDFGGIFGFVPRSFLSGFTPAA